MIKRLLFVLLLFSTISVALADQYLYVENPDPHKFEVIWKGPGPNCSETSGGYQTFGWIRHENGSGVYVIIRPLDLSQPRVCTVLLDGGFRPDTRCDDLGAGDTHWVTVKGNGYKPYRTWACG